MIDVLVAANGRDGMTPMPWAGKKCHAKIVKLLLDAKGKQGESRDSNGDTPLMTAAINS